MSFKSPTGSVWRKWDLHFHTPSSYDYGNRSITNIQLIDGLLSSGIEVVGITDHHTIDVARISELKNLAKDRITILPGIEFRSELGGSNSVHFIAIFPEDCDLGEIWKKLSVKCEITSSDVSQKGGDSKVYCDFVDTSKIVHDLGGLISVHAGSKSNTIEGLKSAKLINQKIKSDLIRGSIDIYEIGDVKDIGTYKEKVFPNLERTVPLITCSDNHNINDYPSDGYFWLKGDRCFEALRQALYEPEARVCVSMERPLAPLLKIDEAVLDFPNDSILISENSTSSFCFRGKHRFNFSPYLTCLIGGRGTGKSTLLNLVHAKIRKGENRFFKSNKLHSSQGALIDECVTIDEGDESFGEIEFIQQNEVEQLALHPEHFTPAVFQRLRKLDKDEFLSTAHEETTALKNEVEEYRELLRQCYETEQDLDEKQKELATNLKLTKSIHNEDYRKLQSELGAVVRGIQKLKSGKERFTLFQQRLESLIEESEAEIENEDTVYDNVLRRVVDSLAKAFEELRSSKEQEEGNKEINGLESKESDLKDAVDQFLRARGLSQENLRDVGLASKRIAELEAKIKYKTTQLDQYQLRIKAFSYEPKAFDNYSNSVESLLDPLNTSLSQLGNQVKPIHLGYEFDSKSADKAVFEELAEKLSDGLDYKIRVDHLSNTFSGIQLKEINTSEEFLKGFSDMTKTGSAVRTYLEVECNFRDFIQSIRIHHLDISKYQRINIFYDGKPIQDSSFGQRCTAAIVVLLLLGNTPIIIDEPEAHLDSSLIANYLVDLVKQKKLERQIIFATHNANFVVNGDAELIHILGSSDAGITTVENTTIENLLHRDRLLSLEGGHEAFVKREHRYGI